MQISLIFSYAQFLKKKIFYCTQWTRARVIEVFVQHSSTIFHMNFVNILFGTGKPFAYYSWRIELCNVLRIHFYGSLNIDKNIKDHKIMLKLFIVNDTMLNIDWLCVQCIIDIFWFGLWSELWSCELYTKTIFQRSTVKERIILWLWLVTSHIWSKTLTL